MTEKSELVSEESQFELIPLSEADSGQLTDLVEEEVSVWNDVLDWDYSRTARLIRDYAAGGMIPGVALRRRAELIGYGYYLLRDELGSIGGIFGSPTRADPESAGSFIFSHIFSRLAADPDCRRIEGQMFTLTHPWRGILERSELQPWERFYMKRRLEGERVRPSISLRPWENDFLAAAANLLFLAYAYHTDAQISALYRSMKGCTEFLKNLVLAPGCGEFLTYASALFVDSQRNLGGFILVTQIGPHAALIPQICVRSDLQGKGIGSGLLEYACSRLQMSGFRKLLLCVTAGNSPARRLYLHHRFHDVQSFSAFYWNRVNP
ncbi:MAG: GNAT family N-acetyltransferase [Acidobacteria bacterium]|nr:GNAT family N-acetyltransferase [Acidobacteriota bacterium]